MERTPRRLVAVLGYSSRRDRELHAICRARLEHAAREAVNGDLVVLTGGRHRALGRPEAEAMQDAWPGPATTLVCERAALSTAQNAAHVRDVALEAGVQEVVVVTSRWHSPRAAALFRRAFRGTGVRVVAAPAPSPWSPGLLLREAACVAALPVQLRRVRTPAPGRTP
jgi:uncharacterized SAM-binding protein YcdF (DUF218 family)